MERKVFISYSSEDNDKKEFLNNLLEKSVVLTPLIVPVIKTYVKGNDEKIMEAIREADYIVPVLTDKSITTQWVNQEIGYVFGIQKRERIFPIVERKITDDLKGFINRETDLSFRFEGSGENSFENKAKELVRFLEENNSKYVGQELEQLNVYAALIGFYCNQGERQVKLGCGLNFHNPSDNALAINNILLSIYPSADSDPIEFTSQYVLDNRQNQSIKASYLKIAPNDYTTFERLQFDHWEQEANKAKEMVEFINSEKNNFDRILLNISFVDGRKTEKQLILNR